MEQTGKSIREELELLEFKAPAAIYKYVKLQLEVNDDILKERQRQNKKWGLQRHNYGKWLSIAGEEFGEFCEAIGPLLGLGTGKETDAQDPYEEAVQLAAVMQAIAEQIKEYRGAK